MGGEHSRHSGKGRLAIGQVESTAGIAVMDGWPSVRWRAQQAQRQWTAGHRSGVEHSRHSCNGRLAIAQVGRTGWLQIISIK